VKIARSISEAKSIFVRGGQEESHSIEVGEYSNNKRGKKQGGRKPVQAEVINPGKKGKIIARNGEEGPHSSLTQQKLVVRNSGKKKKSNGGQLQPSFGKPSLDG